MSTPEVRHTGAGLVAAFSTSSPVASFAAFEGGRLVFADAAPARSAASDACLRMLAASGIPPERFDLWLADLGPGSFTGTRVGVVLAKTLAWSFGKPCGGADAFDLVAPGATVAIPNRKGEWLARIPGEEAKVVPADSLKAVGYAPGLDGETHPLAEGFGPLLSRIEPVAPERLLPGYVVAPSISTPKRATA